MGESPIKNQFSCSMLSPVCTGMGNCLWVNYTCTDGYWSIRAGVMSSSKSWEINKHSIWWTSSSYMFHKSFPPQILSYPPTGLQLAAFTDYVPLSVMFYFFRYLLVDTCIRLNWLSASFWSHDNKIIIHSYDFVTYKLSLSSAIHTVHHRKGYCTGSL